MKRIRFILAALIAATPWVAGSPSARAAGLAAAATRPDAPMSFTFIQDSRPAFWGDGVQRYLFAAGEITNKTPQAFAAAIARYHLHAGDTIVLSSPGGYVTPALKMGRMIREHHFNTEVGQLYPEFLGINKLIPDRMIPYVQPRLAPPFPSYCYSACAWTFLGGVYRSVDPSSDYGVHRFYSDRKPDRNTTPVDEQLMARIANFLQDMKVKSAILLEMSKYGRRHVAHFTEAELATLGVITPAWSSHWVFSPTPDHTPGLYDYIRDRWGTHQIAMFCPSPQARTRGFAIVAGIFIDTHGRIDPRQFVNAATDFAMSIDRYAPIPIGSSLDGKPYISKISGRFGFQIGLNAKMVRILSHAHFLGFSFVNQSLPVRILHVESGVDGAKIAQFAAECRAMVH